MSPKKAVLIIDDHPLFREGLKAIIGRTERFEVVGEAGKGREAIRSAAELSPDLVLVDISLPDCSGIQLTREIQRIVPHARLLMVSVHAGTNYIAESFQAGAAGYLVKESVPETLLQALEVVAEGGYFFESRVSPEAVERLKNLKPDQSGDAMSRYESLTRRQQEVLKLLARGLSYKAVAEKLCVSPRTVENHRAQIIQRLGLRNSAELILFSTALGLLDVPVTGR